MGDARHQATVSDHNQGNAVDITHDPGSGCDGNTIAALAINDPRMKYVIWNRRIYSRARASEGWRAYTGENPHTHHCHISIETASRDDTRHWAWADPNAPVTPLPPTNGGGDAGPNGGGDAYPGVMLRRGSTGTLVRRVQERLRRREWVIGVDGVFGPETDRVVRAFQRRHGLDDDGVVGPRTWRAIFG
jgi:hypothetical protein